MADKEVLTSRIIDRPIRPLFPAGWRHETQIIALVLSADKQNDADVLAITGASAALKLAGIPFDTTIAGVRVGLVDGHYVINPTYEQRKKSLVDIVVAGSKDGLVMVEAGAKEVPEEQVAQALEAGHAAIKQIVAVIDDLAKEAGKPKRQVIAKTFDSDLLSEVEAKALAPLTAAMRIKDKLENYATVDQVKEQVLAAYAEAEPARKADAKAIFSELKEKVLRDEVLERRVRLDGRKFDEIRPIWTRGRRAAPRRTVRWSSRVARHRRWSPARSARPTTSRRSSTSTASTTSASCSTTTSRRSRSVKCSSCAAPAGVKWVTARWPNGR